MAGKPKRLPKLTDEERHKRFVETAREVEASEDPQAFDRAFDKVTKRGDSPARKAPPSKP